MKREFFDPELYREANVTAAFHSWAQTLLNKVRSGLPTPDTELSPRSRVSSAINYRPWRAIRYSGEKGAPELALFIWPSKFYLRDGAPALQIGLNVEFSKSTRKLPKQLMRPEVRALMSPLEHCTLTLYRKLVYRYGKELEIPSDITANVARNARRCAGNPKGYFWLPNPLLCRPVRSISAGEWDDVASAIDTLPYCAFGIGREWPLSTCVSQPEIVEADFVDTGIHIWPLVERLARS